MQQELTVKQQDFLAYLAQAIENRGRVPSLRESSHDLGISHAAVAQFIKTLEKKGYLKREGRYSRNIYLLDRQQRTAAQQRWKEVPVIGKITAGLPIYAQQEWQSSLVVDGDLFRGKNLFALGVKGDSMTKAGIMDGDLVICEPRQYAANGEIVVALINFEEATVKRFYLHENNIELRPESDDFEPTFYKFNEVMVQGRVVGLQRQL